ncbi:EF-hand calcium-binding domain-containing protein 12-like [Cetorhinus maximus]
MQLEVEHSFLKEVIEEPERKLRVPKTTSLQSRRKSRGKEKDGGALSPSNKKLHMTLDDYTKYTRKLKAKLQSVPGSSTNIQTNTNAFWPGRILDKVRMYLPHTQLEHKEVFISSTHEDASLRPYYYHYDKSWPISDQGYLTYGDIEMNKRYWL